MKSIVALWLNVAKDRVVVDHGQARPTEGITSLSGGADSGVSAVENAAALPQYKPVPNDLSLTVPNAISPAVPNALGLTVY